MDIEPIHNSPALRMKHDEECIIAIADLHLGVEHAMEDAGVKIPKRTWQIQEEILQLLKAESVDRLIILGDIKHSVPSTSWQETQELPEFFRGILRSIDQIDIVVGNQDTNLKQLLPDSITFHEASGWRYDNIGFAHGHKWPSLETVQSEILVLAHNHPSVVLVDELDVHHNYPCWVRGPVNREKLIGRYDEEKTDLLNEIILIPSFLEFGSGTAVNDPDKKLLGPFLNNGFLKISKSNVYLLDGTNLGTVIDLMLE